MLAFVEICIRRLALVRVELLLDYRLRPRLLTGGLMFRMELLLTGFTDSDDRNVLDPLYDTKVALGHEIVSHSFCGAHTPVRRLGFGFAPDFGLCTSEHHLALADSAQAEVSGPACTQNAVMVTFRIVPEIRKGSEGVLSL